MIALVGWLWQGLAVAAVTAALIACVRRIDAATRHGIWWSALATVLALPFAPMLFQSVVPAPVTGSTSAPIWLVVPEPPTWLTVGAMVLWLTTAIFGLLRLAAALGTVRRWKRRSTAMPEALQRRLPTWNALRSSGRGPSLRVSPDVPGAHALGFGRPVILVAQTLVDALDESQLDQVVAHEHAHLTRHDDWSRLVEAVIVAVAGLHPAVRFIARRIDLEREASCDDRVVLLGAAAARYAESLAEAARLAARARRQPALIPAVVWSPSMLRRRIVRLLEPGRPRGPRARPWAVAVASAVLAIAAHAAGHITPAVQVVGPVQPLPLVPRPAHAVFAPVPTAIGAFDEAVAAPVGQGPDVIGARAATAPAVRPPAPAPAVGVSNEAHTPGTAGGVSPLGSRRLIDLVDAPVIETATTTSELDPHDDVRPSPRVGLAQGGSGGGTARAQAGTRIARSTARAGVAVAAGARQAATSVGGFFTRTGRAFVRSF